MGNRDEAVLGVLRAHERGALRPAEQDESLVTLAPKLSRARFRPGTEVAHPAATGLAEDVAENVFDLQIALGVDTEKALKKALSIPISLHSCRAAYRRRMPLSRGGAFVLPCSPSLEGPWRPG